MYYWPNNRFFVGFWKLGKQNGAGKYIKGDMVRYGLWKNGKREKWINEDEFADNLDPTEENYSYIFQWNIKQLRKFMDINEKDIVKNNHNEDYNYNNN